MIFLLPIVLFLSIHFEFNFPNPLLTLSLELQTQCSQLFSNPNNLDDLSASFICGKKVTQQNHKNLLQKSGIYHAIVVSGGHFLFLDAVMKWIVLPAPLRLLILFLYYLMTGLQAPGLRCLAQMGLTSAAEKFNLKTNSSTLCFYSGCLCLIISYPLWNSLSFWLSFSVSMSLCFSKELLPQNNKVSHTLLSLVLIYLFLLPFNFTNGYLHPLNLVLGTLFLYPFVSVLLTSAALVVAGHAFSFHFLFSIATNINSMLYEILQRTTVIIPDNNFSRVPSLFSFWVYAFVIISLLHLLTVAFRRETIRE